MRILKINEFGLPFVSRSKIVRAAMLVALLSSGISGTAGAPQDLHGKNLSHKDLKDENLDRADLAEADLQWANLTNATMKGAVLKGADLQNANLLTADLSGADLRGANLMHARLEDAKFVKANVQGTEVYLAYGAKSDEEAMKTTRRMLDDARADLRSLAERNGTITFKEADLRRAKIHGSLEGVDFRRADLRGANFGDTTNPDKAKWKGAVYDSGTRWPNGFEFAAAGAVPGSEEPLTAHVQPSAPPFDPVGTWMIKVESKGATEEGLLTIAKDKTYKWDYSVKAQPIEGSWKTASPGESNGSASSGIILSKGEAGADWMLTPQSAHTDRPDSVELKQVSGQQMRWAVPVSATPP